MSIKERQKRGKVGLRLSDVVAREKVTDPAVIELRGSLQGEPNDRMTILKHITRQLLNMELEEVLEEANSIVKPYHPKGAPKKTLIISSASSSSGSQEFEKGRLDSGDSIVDIPGAIEGRDTRSGKKGDVALISTESGLIMAKAQDVVETINLAEEVVAELSGGQELRAQDLYYKADALLMLLITNPTSPIVLRLIDELAQEPLVYPYNLDEETQVALVILAKMGKIKRIDVNANSSEVGIQLTRKGYRYPTVEAAKNLPHYDDPYQMQKEEWKLSQAAKEIGHHPDVIPGYVIKKASTYEQFREQVLTTLDLMYKRYGFEAVWSKPDRGTDGGNQKAIPTKSNPREIEARIKAMWESEGDWVIEAKTNFFKIVLPINGEMKEFVTSTSVHVIKGEPRSTVSLQLVDGTQWGGNLICTQETWNELIDSIDANDPRIKNNPGLIKQLKASFKQMVASMADYSEAVNRSAKYRGGQVRGGMDLAIATLGGKFGDDTICVAVQDNNARANGCETAYALYDDAKRDFGKRGEAITRNISPKVDFNEFSRQLPDVISKVNRQHHKNIRSEQIKLVAVSAGWGQIGMKGTDAMEILQDIYLIEQELRNRRLIS